ncbi:unnamed protein product [Cochlearia groenlandica]
MDWFLWLSKTNLEASFIYKYSLSFTNNELEHEDISYFDHEFLQSIGISIAKHRLHILNLARKDRTPSPLARVLVAIKKTRRCFSEYVRVWIPRGEESLRALVIVKGKERWKCQYTRFARKKGDLLKRKKKKKTLVMLSNGNKEERLLLTDGKTLCNRFDSFSNASVFDFDDDVEKIKWDLMFKNLKPT